MTGMVHVVVSLIVTAVEDLHAMMEEVTGRGLGLMIAPAGEDVLMIATDDRPSRLKLLMLQFRVPECLMYLSLALFLSNSVLQPILADVAFFDKLIW